MKVGSEQATLSQPIEIAAEYGTDAERILRAMAIMLDLDPLAPVDEESASDISDLLS